MPSLHRHHHRAHDACCHHFNDNGRGVCHAATIHAQKDSIGPRSNSCSISSSVRFQGLQEQRWRRASGKALQRGTFPTCHAVTAAVGVITLLNVKTIYMHGIGTCSRWSKKRACRPRRLSNFATVRANAGTGPMFSSTGHSSTMCAGGTQFGRHWDCQCWQCHPTRRHCKGSH
jgi:hypothetical protein